VRETPPNLCGLVPINAKAPTGNFAPESHPRKQGFSKVIRRCYLCQHHSLSLCQTLSTLSDRVAQPLTSQPRQKPWGNCPHGRTLLGVSFRFSFRQPFQFNETKASDSILRGGKIEKCPKVSWIQGNLVELAPYLMYLRNGIF